MTMQTPDRVREELVRALRLDLVGPAAHHPPDVAYESERLPMSPSRWYLTGFLVPSTAPDEQRSDEASQDELDLAGDADIDGDDDDPPDKPAARRVIFPSSIGLSVLVPEGAVAIEATASWGDYVPEPLEQTAEGESEREPGAPPVPRDQVWSRTGRTQSVRVPIPEPGAISCSIEVPGSGGLKVYASARQAGGGATGLPAGTRAIAVFLVNERQPDADEEKDRAFAFQATLELRCAEGFVPRPDPRRGAEEDWDDRVAELQYADVFEYATGHGVSADWAARAGSCTRVWTTWTPCANVPFVEPAAASGRDERVTCAARAGWPVPAAPPITVAR